MKKNHNNSIIDTASIQDAVKKLDLEKSNSLVTHNSKKKGQGFLLWVILGELFFLVWI